MEPQIVTLPERKLVGKRLVMTFAENRTPDLWRSFMPHRHEIQTSGKELISAAVYRAGFFDAIDPNMKFEKWAAAEVSSFDSVPDDMKTLVIPPGKYAVFHYAGSAANAREVFDYIFNWWLPQSGYKIDGRPHFEILGAKYRHNDPDSEEDIHIPITHK